MKRLQSSSLLLCCPLFALAACAAESTHGLGYTQTEQNLEEEPSEPFFTDAEAFIGSWVGEADDPLAFGAGVGIELPTYQFPSGSSLIRLEIVEAGSSLLGTLSFGEGAPPEPATDPDAGYPTGFDYDSLRRYDPASNLLGGIVNFELGLPPFEGFSYTVRPVSFTGPKLPDGVLRLAYTTNEYVGSWCELQEPVAWPDGTHHVLPFAPGGREVLADGTNQTCSLYGGPDASACPGGVPPADPDLHSQCVQQGAVIATLSCDKVFLSEFCACTDASCAPSLSGQKNLMLRAAGDSLSGAFENALFRNARGLSLPLGGVRFEREE